MSNFWKNFGVWLAAAMTIAFVLGVIAGFWIGVDFGPMLAGV